MGFTAAEQMGLDNQGTTPGRTTLLEAVNICLAAIGEQPVSTLENQQVLEARIAESTILEFHRDGQTRGWSWNRERDYPFARDEGGGITVPANVAEWQPRSLETLGRYQLRGQRVYDRQEHTYQIGLPELRADVVWLLSWDECPEAYNRWALMRAGRVFCGRFLGEVSAVQFAAADEDAAFTELLRMDTQQDRPNVLAGAGPRFPTFRPVDGLRGRRIAGGWL
jgi:hypothetical protein